MDHLFRGYGYTPYFVEGQEPEMMHELMAATLDTVIGEIRRIKADALENGFTARPRWPMIVLRTPKGLIHRLTYRRNGHYNIHVRGYKEGPRRHHSTWRGALAPKT